MSYTFVSLATSTARSEIFSLAGISADGKMICWRRPAPGLPGGKSFLWTEANGTTSPDILDLHYAVSILGLSDNNMLFGVSNPIGTAAYSFFTWTQAGGYSQLPSVPDITVDGVGAISGDGKYLSGTCKYRNTPSLFRFHVDDQSFQFIDFPVGIYQMGIYRMSTDGSVIVGSCEVQFRVQAFIWTASGGFSLLGFLQGLKPSDHQPESVAFAVSSDGSVVTGRSTSARHSRETFRWTASQGMEGLGSLTAIDDSIPSAISSDGLIISGGCGDEPHHQPFIWKAEFGMRNLWTILQNAGLELSGYTDVLVRGMSGDGKTFVGEGINSAGYSELWRATIPYERISKNYSMRSKVRLA